MADDTKKVLVDVELSNSVETAIAKIQELNRDVNQLTASNKELAEAGKANTKEYISNQESIKALKSEISQYSNIVKNQYKQTDLTTGSMNQMSAELGKLKAVYRSLSEEERNSAFGKVLQERAGDINAKLLELEKSYGQFGRQVGNYELVGKSLRTELKELTEQMARMAMAGQQDTEAYKQMAEKAGALKDAQADITEQTKNMASDTAQLDVVKNGVVGVNTALVGLMGVMQLAGGESEEMQKISQKIQVVLGAILALTTLQNLAQKQNTLYIKLHNAQLKIGNLFRKQSVATTTEETAAKAANTTATAAQTKATVSQTTATKGATLWQKLLNAAMKANPVYLLIGAVTALISAYTLFSSKSKEVKEESSTLTDMYDQIGETLGSTVSQYDLMQKRFSSMANTHAEKSKLIQEVNDKFKDYGVKLKDANDLEEFFSTKGRNNFVLAVQARAKSLALQSALTEAYKKQMQALVRLEAMNDNDEIDEDSEEYKKVADQFEQASNDITYLSKQIDANTLKVTSNTTETKKATKEKKKYKGETEELTDTIDAENQAWIEYLASKKKVQESNEDFYKYGEDMWRSWAEGEGVLKVTAQQIANTAKVLGKTQEEIDAVLSKRAEVANKELAELTESLGLTASDNLQKTIDQLRTLAQQAGMSKEAIEKMINTLTSRDQWSTAESMLQEFGSKATEMLSSLDSIASNIEDRQLDEYEEKNEKKKDVLQQRLDAGLISQEQYDAATNQLDEELDAKKAEIDRRQAIREKAMKIFEIGTNTAAAIMKIWAEVPKFDFGVSTETLTAIAAAVGAAQIAAVASEPLPQAARGALLTGSSHKSGGIQIEAEGGEAIINRTSTQRYLPLLSAINQAGGGVPFMDGGYAARSLAASADEASLAGRITALGDRIERMKIAVAVEDIQRGTKKYTKVQNRGNL